MKRKPVLKNKIGPLIRTFCKRISNDVPVLIPYIPAIGKESKQCFSIVPEHIAVNGGKQIIGWHIHVWKRVMMEAEFHCVWEDPSGRLIDITPKSEKSEFSIFLPAPDKKYTGRQIDNIRKALSRDPDIRTLIDLRAQRFRHMNQGDLADKHGKLSELGVDERFLKVLGELDNLMKEIELKIVARYGIPRPTHPY